MPTEDASDDARQKQIRSLESEVARLSDENDRLRRKNASRFSMYRHLSAFASWLTSRWWGTNLVECGDRFASRLDAWSKGDATPPVREGIEFAASAVSRFTRIGIFRGTLAFIAGFGAVILAVGQLLILDRQTTMIEENKRISATDKYVYFLVEEETARRLLGVAFDHWHPMRDLDLSRDSTISIEELRESVKKAIPNKSSVDQIVEKCGLSLYPVRNPIEDGQSALADLENGNILLAKFHAGDLRAWMKKGADSCKERVDLMKRLRGEMESHMELVLAQDESED